MNRYNDRNVSKRSMHYKEYEVAKEVKPYSIQMPCSKCDGEMVFTGERLLCLPPYNIHVCNKCGFKEEFHGVEYPRIEWR